MSNVLITGATGMIGKGVLLECIDTRGIRSITLINRSPVDIQNSRIKQILLEDFTEIGTLASQLQKIDACFHCMGISALGLSEAQYSRITYDVTKKLADMCFALNPEMTFIYVSGAGTDSSENGRTMWARVKGKTENYILAKGFAKTFMFRPGIIIPEKGINSRTKIYRRIYSIMRPAFPLFRKMKSVTTTTMVGQAMIKCMFVDANEYVYLDNKRINEIAAA